MNNKEQLSQAIATVERQISEAKSELAKKTLTGKLERLKEELKTGATKGDSTLSTLSNARKQVRSMAKDEFKALLTRLSKKPEYGFLAEYSQDRLKRDLSRTAKPKGYRFVGDNAKKPSPAQIKKGLKDGTVYYEGRPIRSDVSRVVKLADGGSVGKKLIVGKDDFSFLLDLSDKELSKRLDLVKEQKLRNSKQYMDAFQKKENTSKIEEAGSRLDNQERAIIEARIRVNKMAEGGSLQDRYSAEVGELQTLMVDGKEKRGYPVYVTISGYAPSTVGVYASKKSAQRKVRELKKKNQMASGGNIDDLQFKEIASMTNIRENAIREWAKNNNLSSKDVSNVVVGLGRKQIKAGDLLTAVVGNPNNEYSKEIIEYAKANKGFKLADGGNISSFNWKNFTLKELNEALPSDVEISSISTPMTKDLRFSSPEFKKMYSTKNFTISEHGETEISKGSENIYLEIKCYDAQFRNSEEEYEVKIYSKENHKGLKEVANSVIEKMKKGGNTNYKFADAKIKFRDLAKSNNFDIVVAEGRFEVELDSNDKVKSIVHPNGNRHKASECPIYNKYKKEINHYIMYKYGEGGNIDNSYLGRTQIGKSFYGWKAETTTTKKIKGYDWEITTMKRSSGDLVSTATGGKSEDKGSYSTFTYSPFEDPSYRLVSSKPKMVNEKAVTKQHEEAVKIFLEKMNEFNGDKMATGGRVKTIKETDIQEGRKFVLMNGEEIEIKRLFKENGDENWVEYERNGKTNENSVNQLKNFINYWRPNKMETGGLITGTFQAEIGVPYNYEKVVEDKFGFTEFLSKTLTKKWFGNGIWDVKITKPLFEKDYGQKVIVEIKIPVGVTQEKGLKEYDIIEFLSKTLTKKWFGNGLWGVNIVEKMATGGEVPSSLNVTRMKSIMSYKDKEKARNAKRTLNDLYDGFTYHIVEENDEFVIYREPSERNFLKNLNNNIGNSSERIDVSSMKKEGSFDSQLEALKLFESLWEKGDKIYYLLTDKGMYYVYSEPKKSDKVLKEVMATGGEVGDYLPPAKIYGENIGKAMEKFGISESEARKRYGNYTIKQWSELLKEKMENGGEVGDISKSEISKMQKIKNLRGLYDYMPSVNTVYYDSRTDKYYFEDFEGDYMELRNIATLEQLHKFMKENNITLDKKMAHGGNLDKVKVGDIIFSHTGVPVKVVAYDPDFGGSIKGVRMDKYGSGETSGWMSLNKFKFADGGNVDYTYLPNEDISKIVLKSKQVIGKDRILDGAYIKKILIKTPIKKYEPSKTDADALFTKIKAKAKELDPTQKFGRDYSFTKEMVEKLLNAGYSEKEVMAIVIGLNNVIDFKCDNEYGTYYPLQGLTVTSEEYQNKFVDSMVESIESNTFELGLKFPNFDWSKIIKKYNISEIPIEIKQKTDYSNENSTVYTYNCFVGDKIVIGQLIKRETFENGKLEYTDTDSYSPITNPLKQTEYQKERDTKAGFNSGFWGIVSSSKSIIMDVAETLFSQPKGYIKDVDYILNNLGGVGAEELTDNNVKFKKGGNTDYTYVPNSDIDRIIATDGKEYGQNVLLDGAYVTDKVRKPKMSRTQFEDETFEYGQGGGIEEKDKGKLSFKDWMESKGITVYKRTYYWVADDGGNDYMYVADTKNEVLDLLKEEWSSQYSTVDSKMSRGGGVDYQDIKKEKQKMTTELFEKCGVFFAFSDKQFEENKTPLKEGEKYVSIGGGGYMPKGSIKAFEEGMKAINNYGKQKVKKGNLEESEILYELQNHECFYTGDISDVVDLFEGTYTEKQIRDVYNKYREENQEYALGGEITAEERNQALKNYPKFNF